MLNWNFVVESSLSGGALLPSLPSCFLLFSSTPSMPTTRPARAGCGVLTRSMEPATQAPLSKHDLDNTPASSTRACRPAMHAPIPAAPSANQPQRECRNGSGIKGLAEKGRNTARRALTAGRKSAGCPADRAGSRAARCTLGVKNRAWTRQKQRIQIIDTASRAFAQLCALEPTWLQSHIHNESNTSNYIDLLILSSMRK